MSIETHVDPDVDLEENEGVATIVERRELHLEDLFQERELRPWEDDTGWTGFLREGDDVRYFTRRSSSRPSGSR